MALQAYGLEEWERVPTLSALGYSQSLERGLAILECFTPERPVLGVAEIADRLGMSRSTTHRYVTTLVALGFLGRGALRRYRRCLRVTKLGMSTMCSTGLREQARPYLEELRQRTSFAVGLSVLDGAEVLYVDGARSLRRGQSNIDLNLRPGSRLPAYCTSMGKVLLANLPEVERRDLIAEIAFTHRGPNSIMSKKALLAELAYVFDEGVAFEDEELAAGVVAIACPVRDERREVVAALSLAAHTSMISVEEMADRVWPHLLATADGISARLGYRREDEVMR